MIIFNVKFGILVQVILKFWHEIVKHVYLLIWIVLYQTDSRKNLWDKIKLQIFSIISLRTMKNTLKYNYKIFLLVN
jgi:hypothetical protein